MLRKTLLTGEGALMIAVGTTTVGSCSEGERLGSTLKTVPAVGIYSSAGWMSGDRKSLRENIRGMGIFGQTRFLLKTVQEDQMSPGRWWELRNLLRYGGGKTH